MKRFLAALLLLTSCLCGQQLYPHNLETPPIESPSIRLHAAPTPFSDPDTGHRSLEIYLRALSTWDVPLWWSTGQVIYMGDFVGHFWTVIDFNIENNPVPNGVEVPNHYDGTYSFDWDLVLSEELHLPTPVQPAPGPYWYNFWFSQTLTGMVSPSVSLFPPNAVSVIFDAVDGGYAHIPIARFVYPVSLQGTWVQIHVIANMWHEVDGQGWYYLSTQRLL